MKLFGKSLGLAAVSLLLVLIACVKSTSEPPRPAGVPESAFWVGGADSGVFVLLEKPPGQAAHVYRARIYYQSGKLWYEGNLAMIPPERPEVDLRKPELFSAWDGESLHLTDGRKLTRVTAQHDNVRH